MIGRHDAQKQSDEGVGIFFAEILGCTEDIVLRTSSGDPHTTKEPVRGGSTSLGKSLNPSGEVPSANLPLDFRGLTPWPVNKLL